MDSTNRVGFAKCANPLSFDWVDAGAMATPRLETAVYRLSDSLGATTEFTHEFIVNGGANEMLFSERPFGDEANGSRRMGVTDSS